MRAVLKFVGLVIFAGFLMIGTGGVASAVDENASCLGVLAEAFSCEGLAEEVEMVKALADTAGLSFGQVVAALARETGDVDFCLSLLPM